MLVVVGQLASSAPPVRAADEDPPHEPGRMLAQLGVGAAVAAGGLLLTVASLESELALIAVLGTPSAVGGTVCAIGDRGAYLGSCAASILGAYLGAASLVPLLYWMERPSGGGPGSGALFFETRHIVAILATWLFVQPLLSTAAWQVLKHPRPPAPDPYAFSRALLPADRRPPPVLPRRPDLAPRPLLAPLLSRAF
jgi:hypothetical protein